MNLHKVFGEAADCAAGVAHGAVDWPGAVVVIAFLIFVAFITWMLLS